MGNTRNVELFDRIADQIEHHPETYDQDSYYCGTAHCVAGHALALSGYYMRPHSTSARHPDGGWVDISDEAQRLLGLTAVDACDLFSADWRPFAFNCSAKQVAGALRRIGRGGKIL